MNRLINKNSENTVKQEYNRLAHNYDKRWTFYIQATLRETVKRLDLQPSDRLLDIGCGTASLFQIISTEYPEVKLVGVDLSTEMLKVARKKLDNNTVLIAAEAQYLPFPSESFDIVVSCNAFHYWRRPEECLSEIARVLRPKGRFVISDWCDDYIACRLCDLFLRFFDRAHFRTYGQQDCKRLLQISGFKNVQVEQYKINWLWGLMTAKGQNTSLNQEGVKNG